MSSHEEFYTGKKEEPSLFLSAVIQACLSPDSDDAQILESLKTCCPKDISKARWRGKTAAHIAASAGKASVLEFILERDDKALEIQDNSGDTPLHLLNACGNRRLFEDFSERYPDVAFIENNKGVLPVFNVPQSAFAPQVCPIVWRANNEKKFEAKRFPIGTSLKDALKHLELDETTNIFPNLLAKAALCSVFSQPIVNLDYRMGASQDFVCDATPEILPRSPTYLDYEAYEEPGFDSDSD
eukprot:TRINITY_DN8641_c0_g1_i1.p1 TRINITY_DN8641_c0_g1~~TRINITY_DN8641_c0_g1_i1.p1  ORF type:complete len:241 (-),score=47.28 TRINITY_DN8641_c0_g1_i1:157-879(-)